MIVLCSSGRDQGAPALEEEAVRSCCLASISQVLPRVYLLLVTRASSSDEVTGAYGSAWLIDANNRT